MLVTHTGGPQSLGGHFDDLKSLIIRLILTFAVGVAIASVFSSRIFELFLTPIKDIQVKNDGIQSPLLLNFIQVGGPLAFQLDMIFFGAIVITSPIMLFFIWQYIKPALLPKEQKFAGFFVVASSILAVLGAIWAYKFIVPFSLRFFTQLNLNPALARTEFGIDANGYIDFFKMLFMATLVTFQVPLFFFAALRSKIISRDLIEKNRKILYFIVMVTSFVLVPGDISTSILVLLPMVVLLELALLLGTIGVKK